VFNRDGIVVIPNFLETEILEAIEKVFQTEFHPQVILDGAREFGPKDSGVYNKLNFYFNSESFLAKISSLTGIKSDFALSRIYYTDPSCSPLDWHDDSYSRFTPVMAVRIELSRVAYEGGNFFFKHEDRIKEIKDLHFGDGVLFKVVTDKYFHRVDPVTAGIRRSIIIFFTRKDPLHEEY
jgi:hypothetical protein